MSKLYTKKDDENKEKDKKLGFLPAVLKSGEEISLQKAMLLSTFGHIFGSMSIWGITALIAIILALLGISLDLFKKPEMKMRDIEFVLVNKEAPPINKKTKYRADKNSRAGGKHNPKKKVSDPTPPKPKSKPQKKAVKKQQTPKPTKKPTPKPKVAVKQPTPPRPAPKASMPKPVPAPPNAFSVPIPKTKMPRTINPGGPVSTAPLGARTPSSSPAPVMAPSASTSGNSMQSSPYSLGSGSIGNPSPGNPNGAPGVDALAEPDFGPYMRDLQAKIKRNWDPPKSNQSKRVVLVFTIAKDGRLLNVKIGESSGIPSIDKAAIASVEYAAPFKPLPKEFRGAEIDIHFTFDYNVFGISY